MVEQMVVSQGIARNRIFVTGLSAGGAMTVAMLATYPEVFAGGAVLAGLPYGAARNANEAFEAMFQGKSLSAKEWGDKVRAASGGHTGPWPRLSVWHGDRDTTVLPSNAEALVQQWTNLHGLPQTPSAADTVDGYPRQVWRGGDGEIAVEHITVTGMAHGLPLDQARGGKTGPFMLEAGIPSSHHIAHMFGLAGKPEPAGVTRQRPDATPTAWGKPEANDATHHGLTGNVAAVISKALKSAGLLRG
jgi:feruloyl esterase